MDTAKENAEKGLFLLKEGVLEVLFHAHLQNEGRVKQRDIRIRLGLPDARFGMNLNELVYQVLQHLAFDGYADHYIGTHKGAGWKITQKGIDSWDN